MVTTVGAPARPPIGLMTLIAAQSLCAVFFVGDVIADISRDGGVEPHIVIEILAVLALIAGLVFEIRYIGALLRRQVHLQRAASMAAAAMADVIEAHFTDWRLSPAEHDVANLLVKGLSIAEIAALRGSAEGTVKSQLNAIYRKSGCQNRGEVLACIIDSVMERDTTSLSVPPLNQSNGVEGSRRVAR